MEVAAEVGGVADFGHLHLTDYCQTEFGEKTKKQTETEHIRNTEQTRNAGNKTTGERDKQESVFFGGFGGG